MGNDPSSELILIKPRQNVRCPTNLEGSNPLKVFAFEKEFDFRSGWALTFVRSPDEIFFSLRRRC